MNNQIIRPPMGLRFSLAGSNYEVVLALLHKYVSN
jgi:hypothetical protein